MRQTVQRTTVGLQGPDEAQQERPDILRARLFFGLVAKREEMSLAKAACRSKRNG